MLRDHSLHFNLSVTLPKRLSYQLGKMKSFKLFQTFSAKGPITVKWSNMPSRADFKSSLEIDNWFKRSNKIMFKASLSFRSKRNYVITMKLPQSIKAFYICPVLY